MGRKILFITTDQMRFDALGCNGGKVARTPVIDRLAAMGINYMRAHNQNVLCMPARSTMISGQYVRTHGVWINGVPLPPDAPSVAAHLKAQAGYQTALIGKAHFEPFMDPEIRFTENRMAREGGYGPYRGFDRVELSGHTGRGLLHYPHWLAANYPEETKGFYRITDRKLDLNDEGGGDTGAVQVGHNSVPREHYHTDWVADRAIAWLKSLEPQTDWFCWMSFPDPHHPWDPPQSELHRVDWRELELPAAYPGSPEKAARILRGKPRHWLEWFEGVHITNFEAPPAFVPAAMTPDQVREINAMVHIENELIDEACGRVLDFVEEQGWGEDTDVFFTTDHGEFQGDFGLLFKGPYHVDCLMRLPLIWRPAPALGAAPAVVEHPVGQVDFAPTFCQIAGLEPPAWMEGQPLPASPGEAEAQKRERVLTEWDSEYKGDSIHMRTIHRDGFTCTVYEKSNIYEGVEGELYDLGNDPNQWENLWDDPARASLKSDLVADLYDHLPETPEQRRPRLAPA